MKIVINTEEIPEDLNLTLFFILYCLFHRQQITYLITDIEALQDKGYVKITEQGIEFRTKTLDLFNPQEDIELKRFLEVFNYYPLKTYTGRRLRPSSWETVEGKKLFEKYKKRVTTDKKHQYVLGCLLRELEARKKANDIGYMQAMEVWINGEKWDRYAPDSETLKEENKFIKDV